MNQSAQQQAVAPPPAAEQALTLRYRVDEALLHEAMIVTGRELMRRRPEGENPSPWRALALVLAILIGIAAVVDLVRYAGVSVELIYLFIGLAAGFGIYNTFLDRGYRRIARLMAANPVFAGELVATLDPRGVEIRGDASLSRLDWQAVDDVLVLESGALVLLVPSEILPIPEDALPPGLTRAELVARIERWRERAAERTDDQP